MSFPKFLFLTAVFLFGGIFFASLFKKEKKEVEDLSQNIQKEFIEIELNKQVEGVVEEAFEEGFPLHENKNKINEERNFSYREQELPDADRAREFFNVSEPKLPIVETIVYTSKVPWVKGRPAWIADYASHYNTSRYFISRSLSGIRDYFMHSIVNGDRFNVYRQDKNIHFHLLVDIFQSKMWLYYVDVDSDERVLVKTYPVGLGRLDETKTSGSLTPVGTYSLGKRVAIYSPGIRGYFNHHKVEMIRVFGTRWIPFEEEISECTAPAKGLGIHGLPWGDSENSGKLVELKESLGKYESDGCIRLATEDIEEIYSIIITQPSYIHLVKKFYDAKIPGKEKL